MKTIVLLVSLLTLTACSTPGRLTMVDRSGEVSTATMHDCDIVDRVMVCADGTGQIYLIGPGYHATYQSDWRLAFPGPAPEQSNPCATPHSEWMLCP